MSVFKDKSVAKRRLRPIAGVALSLILISPSAAAVVVSPQGNTQTSASAAAAQEFVRSELNRGLSILNDRGTADADRRARLRAFLNSFMDIRRIALFSLGVARRSATQEQIDQFVEIFRQYAVAYFESLLTRYYSGQAVRIAGATGDGSNGYTVHIVLDSAPNATGKNNQPIDLAVRVTNDSGRFAITDVAAVGVWFSQQQRDEINEYLLETHGNFGGLLVRYKTFALRKQSAGAQRI